MWGREPGLRISADGSLLWMEQKQADIELWVSADERLILYRLEHAVTLTLRRGNRALDVPATKPVVLRHGDVIESAEWSYRVHLHGTTASTHAPEPVAAPRRSRLFRATAAALTLAALGTQTGVSRGADAGVEPDATTEDADVADAEDDAIDVREQPPAPVDPPKDPVEGAALCSVSAPGFKR
jgi:hypothetical protein